MKRGQGLVEFALILPLLLLLIIGTLDLARLFHAKVVTNNAAREGAYYLSYFPEDKTNCLDGVCYQGTIDAAFNEAQNVGITLDRNLVFVDESLCCTSGLPIEVSVRHVINLAILDFFTGPFTLESTVRMMVQ